MNIVRSWLATTMLLSSQLIGQNPIPYTSNLSAVTYGNQQNYYSEYNVVNITNSNFNNYSKTDLLASDNIHIGPTSMAGSFNTSISGWDPYFHAGIAPFLLKTASFHPSGFTDIPKYDRFELGIILPNSVQQDINTFLSSGTGGKNPYDPNQVKIKATFTHLSSSTSYERFGFYYQDYYVDANDKWIETPTDYKFRVRFAPPKTGDYQVLIEVFFPNISSNWQYRSWVAFNAVESNDKGFLKVSTVNPRRLQFDNANGDPYFAMGQGNPGARFDFTHPNYPNLISWPGGLSSATTHNDHRNEITNLADNDGNFVRMSLDPWSVPIITKDKSSPQVKSDIRSLKDYSMNQPFLWEFDKTLAICEARDIRVFFTLLLDQYYSVTNGYNTEAWSVNPFHSLLDPNPNPTYAEQLTAITKLFDITDNSALAVEARSYLKNMFYYIHARWGYSSSIGIWSIINETQGIGGGGDMQTYPNGPYLDDVNFRNKVNSWICDIGGYLQSMYPYHPITTGYMDHYSTNIVPTCLNIWSVNFYPVFYDAINQKYQDDNHYFIGRASIQYQPNTIKPFIAGEFGHSDIIADVNYYTDRTYHNGVWASSMSGSFGNGINWVDQKEAYVTHRPNFRALRSFFDNQVDINLDYGFYRIESPGYGSMNNKRIHNYYMRTNDKTTCIGWFQNNSSNWTQDYFTFPTSNPNLQALVVNNINFNSNTIESYDCGITTNDPEVVLTGVNPNSLYALEIFDTYNPNSSPIYVGNATSFSNGELRFRINTPADAASGYYPDYAYKATYIAPRESQSQESIETLSTANTNLSSINSEKNGIVGSIENNKTSISVIPNPSKGKFQLYSMSKSEQIINVYNALGALVKTFSFIGPQYEVNIEDLSPGIYNFVVKSKDSPAQSIKVIKE